MNISDYLLERNIPFEENVLLSKKTWIKTGGLCTYWITPESRDQLVEICRFLYRENIVFDVVGQTSNMFFHSTYNPQVVVSTLKMKNFSIEDDIIICECGVSVVKLAKACLAKGYAGFYGLVGLPGTVASAIVNNSGCFNCSVSSMLVSADVLLPDGCIQIIKKEDFNYSKRSSAFKRGEKKGVILCVRLKTEKVDSIEEENQKAEDTKVYRKKKQEGPNRNLGSVYGRCIYKHSPINLMISAIIKVVRGLGLSYSCSKLQKNLLLFFYGYLDLNNYISDKNINTFIWNDDKAEWKFKRYKAFMRKVYKNLELEIEERV